MGRSETLVNSYLPCITYSVMVIFVSLLSVHIFIIHLGWRWTRTICHSPKNTLQCTENHSFGPPHSHNSLLELSDGQISIQARWTSLLSASLDLPSPLGLPGGGHHYKYLAAEREMMGPTGLQSPVYTFSIFPLVLECLLSSVLPPMNSQISRSPGDSCNMSLTTSIHSLILACTRPVPNKPKICLASNASEHCSLDSDIHWMPAKQGPIAPAILSWVHSVLCKSSCHVPIAPVWPLPINVGSTHLLTCIVYPPVWLWAMPIDPNTTTSYQMISLQT